MKFHPSRKSLKKLSIVALALLPLGYATAASADPVISTFASLPSNQYASVAVNAADNVFAAAGDSIYEITPSGVVSTFASVSRAGVALAISNDGTLYATESGISGQRIYQITDAGVVSQLEVQPQNPWGITVLPSGVISVAQGYIGSVTNIDTSGNTSVVSLASLPTSNAINSAYNPMTGSVEVATCGINGVVAISSSGSPSVISNTDTSGCFYGIAVSSNGSTFVSNYSLGTVLKLNDDGSFTAVATGLSAPAGLSFNSSGDLYVAQGDGTILKISGLGVSANNTTGPNTVSNLAVATVGHATLKLTWGSDNSSDTQYVCTASNGASVTVTGNSCSLKGFDLYHSGNYTVSVTAVNSQGQSDPVTLNVQL